MQQSLFLFIQLECGDSNRRAKWLSITGIERRRCSKQKTTKSGDSFALKRQTSRCTDWCFCRDFLRRRLQTVDCDKCPTHYNRHLRLTTPRPNITAISRAHCGTQRSNRVYHICQPTLFVFKSNSGSSWLLPSLFWPFVSTAGLQTQPSNASLKPLDWFY